MRPDIYCPPSLTLIYLEVNYDGVVKSLRFRHSHAGGNPEAVEITRSKSLLISRLRGNDETFAKCTFYKFVNYDVELTGVAHVR